MRYFIAAIGLAFALAFGPAAIAAPEIGWDNSSNGNGYYHASNG